MSKETPVHICETSVQRAARRYRSLGCSVIPLHGHRPERRWRVFQQRRIAPRDLPELFGPSVTGVGVVVGPVSSLCVLDIDRRTIIPRIRSLVDVSVLKGIVHYNTRRGMHLWFAAPREADALPSSVAVPGADLLLRSHYVWAPPRGDTSRLFGARIRTITALPVVPTRLIEWFLKERGTKGKGSEPDDWNRHDRVAFFFREERDPIPHGDRVNFLFRVAGVVLATPYGDAARDVGRLRDVAMNIDGLSEREVASTIQSALRMVMLNKATRRFDKEFLNGFDNPKKQGRHNAPS